MTTVRRRSHLSPMTIPASGGVHESCTQSEDPLIGSFTRVYDAVMNHSCNPQLSDEDLESISKVYESLSNVPLRDALAALHSLKDTAPKASLDTHAAVERCSESPSCEPLFHVEHREWSPREHAHLPTPTQVFSAPILSEQGGANVAKVTDTLVAKYGTRVSFREADAMRYVSTRTSIPIPKVHGVYQYDSNVFIFMDFIHGQTLDDVWTDMAPDLKIALIRELKFHMDSLRSLQGTYVGGVFRTPCSDRMFRRVKPWGCGPFPNVPAFHNALIRTLDPDPTGYPHPTSYRKMFNDDCRIVFCHGDFACRNVMVSQEGSLAAIIDWETSGFWPEYWEWLKANIGLDEGPVDWGDALEIILKPYDAEALIERIFLRKLLY